MDGIIGHEDALATLRRSVREGTAAHAYLFVGPEGIGKATLARWLAKALTCREPDAPCAACRVCRRIENGTHSDVETIRPGGLCDQSDHDHTNEASRDIRICQVRRAERTLGIAAFEGGRRVTIIDPAEAMNAQSADAFLKTLEEPPNGAVIILVTANEGALSETIRSRCRRVPLAPLPAATVEAALRERFEATPEQAAALVRLFGGQIGKAVAALRDPAFAERRAAMLEAAAGVLTATLVERFKLAEDLATAYGKREAQKLDDSGQPVGHVANADGKARTRPDVYATLDLWIEWWRDLLLVSAGADAVIANAEHAPRLRDLASRLDPASAAEGVRALRSARRDLEQNINPRLALESLMLRLPRASGHRGNQGHQASGAAPARRTPVPDAPDA